VGAAYCKACEAPVVESASGLPDSLWIGATPETAAWYDKRKAA
jgi:hypothetical protein